jgi:hypothetical protein
VKDASNPSMIAIMTATNRSISGSGSYPVEGRLATELAI